ncbi:hypothetical protein LUZ60_000094 [Juncus effusus]|nr:hypothetical protein LUZ60_000094 [Juncus effusus]
MSCRQAGDWNCTTCAYLNFGKRDSCQRCGKSKLGLPPGTGGTIQCNWDIKPGDWYCYSCGVHNYANRTDCFKCGGATKTESAVTHSWGISIAPQQPAVVWKSGDWLCSRPGCNEHNYANRTECYRCNMPRYYG